MDTNFKVIGLTRLGIKPQSIQLPRRRLLPLGHLSCKSHVQVQINRSSILAVEQNFAFIGYKTLMVILHTSSEKSEILGGGGQGRCDSLWSRKLIFVCPYAATSRKVFHPARRRGVPVALLVTYQTKSRVLFPQGIIKDSIGIQTSWIKEP